jgi:hypothetical protein
MSEGQKETRPLQFVNESYKRSAAEFSASRRCLMLSVLRHVVTHSRSRLAALHDPAVHSTVRERNELPTKSNSFIAVQGAALGRNQLPERLVVPHRLENATLIDSSELAVMHHSSTSRFSHGGSPMGMIC